LLGVLMCGAALALLAALAAVWAVAIGALIKGAELGSNGTPGALRGALNSGLRSAWRLIVIASIPPIPLLASLILSTIGVGIYLHMVTARGDVEGILIALLTTPSLRPLLIACNVPFALLTLGLLLLQTLALRACVLDDLAPGMAYRTAWRVLRCRLYPVTSLTLLCLALAVGATLALIGASLLLNHALLIRLPALILHGGVRAFTGVTWTLAWLKWRGSVLRLPA
jgi:hypothetical protein